MTRSRRRSTRRSQKHRPLWVFLAILALAAWYWVQDPFAPDITARVLFSETANCTPRERLLVAGVMHNRIHNPAFGNSPTLQAVVRQPGAFSCINDPNNANWQKSLHPSRMTPAEKSIWQQCLTIANTPIPPALGPSGRPLVYYHDKSITKPPSWTNAKWQAIRELSTEHFIFYSILPAPPARRWFTPPQP